MNISKSKMRIGLGIIVAVLLGYEALALFNPAEGDTISEVVWELTDKWAVVPLIFGILMGHFFFFRYKKGK